MERTLSRSRRIQAGPFRERVLDPAAEPSLRRVEVGDPAKRWSTRAPGKRVG